MPTSTFPNDAIVIGGSYAGLSAALQLARARRRVLVEVKRLGVGERLLDVGHGATRMSEIEAAP